MIFFPYCVSQRMEVHRMEFWCQTHQLQTHRAVSFFTNDGERESGEEGVYFCLKVAAFRIRCLHLEISHTLSCGAVQALIIHSETCASTASSPWLFTYLKVCLPLRLHLQLSVQSAVHNQWGISPLTRIISASQLPAIFNLLGSHWQRISLGSSSFMWTTGLDP